MNYTIICRYIHRNKGYYVGLRFEKKLEMVVELKPKMKIATGMSLEWKDKDGKYIIWDDGKKSIKVITSDSENVYKFLEMLKKYLRANKLRYRTFTNKIKLIVMTYNLQK